MLRLSYQLQSERQQLAMAQLVEAMLVANSSPEAGRNYKLSSKVRSED
jgi:hypothetical protein